MEINQDKITHYFEEIINICDRTTSGNISHQMNLIRHTYDYIADKIKEKYGEILAYYDLKHVVELVSRVTSGNLSHNIITIKELCLQGVKYIKKHGLI